MVFLFRNSLQLQLCSSHYTLLLFKPKRMTWIKPSFSWVLYRSGYAQKHNQQRILKVKLSHKSLAEILSRCECKHSGGGSWGRVQWDPARDLMYSEKGEPRKLLNKRAIQIGMKGPLSELYVKSVLSIQDVTSLALMVGIAHNVLVDKDGMIMKNTNKKNKKSDLINNEEFLQSLPNERTYLPKCSQSTLEELGMKPGKTADDVAGLGRGGHRK